MKFEEVLSQFREGAHIKHKDSSVMFLLNKAQKEYVLDAILESQRKYPRKASPVEEKLRENLDAGLLVSYAWGGCGANSMVRIASEPSFLVNSIINKEWEIIEPTEEVKDWLFSEGRDKLVLRAIRI